MRDIAYYQRQARNALTYLLLTIFLLAALMPLSESS